MTHHCHCRRSLLLPITISICLLAITIPATLLLFAERANVGAVPRTIAAEGDATRLFLGTWLTANLIPPLNSMVGTVNRLPDLVVGEVGKQATATRASLTGEVHYALVEVLGPNGRFARLERDVVTRADTGLGIIQDLRTDNVGPTLTAVNDLLSNSSLTLQTFAGLPDRIGQTVGPSWAALEPELTCRFRDAAGVASIGYGGCWHSRITALMGEAARVGGIFTQHAPSMFATVDGIGEDVHGWTRKYVMPHPLTTWGKVKVGLGVVSGVGIAGLRSGAF